MQLTKLVQTILAFCVILTHLQGVRMESDEDDELKGDAHIIYDQRQSGKYNIHVVIKDVAIIEMDQNEIEDASYNEEDYYYDEDDLTVKPITLNPTTTTATKPSTTTTNNVTPTMENLTTSKVSTTQFQTKFPPTTKGDSEITFTDQQDEPTTLPSSKLWNTLKSLISKNHSIEEVATTETTANYSATKQTALPNELDIKPRSKVEPIYAVEEAALQPMSRDDSLTIGNEAKTMTNSKIYKVKVHRSHQPHHHTPLRTQSRRCRSNQYRDLSGNCHTKRTPSGSLLKRLFSMLVTLPFVRGEQRHPED